tara:strand:- start:232 stop:813 length:582 start_codon:yes stop_codon:yes gene_type:complete
MVISGFVSRHGLWFRVGLITFVAMFIVFGAMLLATGKLDYQSIGYPGIWLVSLIGAGSMILPVPGLAVICVGASPSVGLHPAMIGIVAGSGETLGEMTGYLAGLSGNTLLQKHRMYPKVRNWLIDRGAIVLFVLSVIPNPIFDLIGLAAGGIRYPLKKFLITIFIGKSIKSGGIAYACYFGVSAIQNLADNVF